MVAGAPPITTALASFLEFARGAVLVAHNAPSPYRRKVIETFEKHKTRLNIAVELPSLEAIKRLVARGVGVALVPRITARAEIAAGLLKELTVREMKLERKLNIIYRRNSELSHAAMAFLKVAKELGGKN